MKKQEKKSKTYEIIIYIFRLWQNLVDSEEMLEILTDNRIEITDDEQEADVIVVNTCCFIHDAKEESIQNILDMARYRTERKLRALIVTICLAQRYKEEIRQEIPEVDAVLGTLSYDEIMTAINTALQEKLLRITEILISCQKWKISEW